MYIMLDDLVGRLDEWSGRRGDSVRPTSLRLWTPTEAPIDRSRSWTRADGGVLVVHYNERDEIVAIDFPSPREEASAFSSDRPCAAVSWSELVEWIKSSGLEEAGLPPGRVFYIDFVHVPPGGIRNTEEWWGQGVFRILVNYDEDGRIPSIEFV